MSNQYVTRPGWLRRTSEAVIEPGTPNLRSPSSPVGPAEQQLPRGGTRSGYGERAQHRLHGVHRVRSRIPLRRGRGASGQSARLSSWCEKRSGPPPRSAARRTSLRVSSVSRICVSERGSNAFSLPTPRRGRGRFRGIRHCVATDADTRVPPHRIEPPLGLLADRAFREGFACLQPFGASFEAWAYHPQLPELLDLARAFPGTTIVLNHVGGPLGVGPYADDRTALVSQWRDSISALARCPNVFVKLGGFGMTLFGFGWENRPQPPSSEALADAVGPFVHHCIDCFGVERAVFESNFPVDKVSCGYGILWNAFKRIAARYCATEQDALFHDNSVRLYRLDGSSRVLHEGGAHQMEKGYPTRPD